MAESIGDDELRGRLTAAHINQVDKMMPPPSERARIVWEAIQRHSQVSYISNWDVVCFSVETLGLMAAEFPWLQEAAKQVSALVYKAHYLNHDKIQEHETEVMRIGVPRVEDNGKSSFDAMGIPKMSGE